MTRPRQPPPSLPGSYLVVELTNRCSLACVHCSVSEPDHPHHARTGYLDPAIFEALIDDLVEVGAHFDTLIPFWLGEPLLHPHFSHIWRHALRAADQHGIFDQIEVHTNGTHLSADRVQAVLNEARPRQVWHLSLDAASRETYLAVKGVDRFERVEAQVLHLLDRKAATGAPWPRVVLQFIVGPNNAHEVGLFAAQWQAAARARGLPCRAVAGHVPPPGAEDEVLVFFRQLDCPTPAAQEAANAIFRAEMAALGLRLPAAAAQGARVEAHNCAPCSGFWKSPVVSWRGELTVCTRDNGLENQLGDLRQTPFSALWWGRGAAASRARVAAGDYRDRPLCQACFIPKSLNHAALSPAEIGVQRAFDEALHGPMGAP